MRRCIQIGDTFGRLTVLSEAARHNDARRWNVRCACGAERVVWASALFKGRSRSCGCLKREAVTHGDARGGRGTFEYRVWSYMISRCENPKQSRFKDYGDRGIRVCAAWRTSFATFLSDMGRAPSDEHQIDRIDNDGDYEPSNCRWATTRQQGRNRRTNRMITIGNERRCLTEWAEMHGINPVTASSRIRKGWDPVRAVTVIAAPRRVA